jgi:hypothetical protein
LAEQRAAACNIAVHPWFINGSGMKVRYKSLEKSWKFAVVVF